MLRWTSAGATTLALSQLSFFAYREADEPLAGTFLSLGVLAFGVALPMLGLGVPGAATRPRHLLKGAMYLGLLTGVLGGLMGLALETGHRGAYVGLALGAVASSVATLGLALWDVAPGLRQGWWILGVLGLAGVVWADADGSDFAWAVADGFGLLLPALLCLAAAFEPQRRTTPSGATLPDWRGPTQVAAVLFALFAFADVLVWAQDAGLATTLAWEFAGMLPFLVAGLLALEWPRAGAVSRRWTAVAFGCLGGFSVWLQAPLLPPRLPLAVDALAMLALPATAFAMVRIHPTSGRLRSLATVSLALPTAYALVYLLAEPAAPFSNAVAWTVFQELCLVPGLVVLGGLLRRQASPQGKLDTASDPS